MQWWMIPVGAGLFAGIDLTWIKLSWPLLYKPLKQIIHKQNKCAKNNRNKAVARIQTWQRYVMGAMIYVVMSLATCIFIWNDYYHSLEQCAWRSAVWGALVYFWYHATNIVMFAEWSWSVAFIDTLWGSCLWCIVGTIGSLILKQA